MCIHVIRTIVASFCVRNLPFSIIKKNFPFETCYTFDSLNFVSKMLHSIAVEESNNLRPYVTVLFLFGTSDVVHVEADLSCLGCCYQFNSSHWYDGAAVCKAL